MKIAPRDWPAGACKLSDFHKSTNVPGNTGQKSRPDNRPGVNLLTLKILTYELLFIKIHKARQTCFLPGKLMPPPF